MKTLTFKTNIHEPAAVEAITQSLNAIEPIDGWRLETERPDGLLTIQTIDNRIADQVVEAVAKAGYKAEWIPEA
ncbi:copper chaperone [Tellurirhabdus rosea]|uniref:copper chaperone n=1 Tax=Tellurirhabdus rosea TaxID=2674997 RepID=UPI0022533A0D|nr:copper chaperone [Tellurirhabdus rosea]